MQGPDATQKKNASNPKHNVLMHCGERIWTGKRPYHQTAEPNTVEPGTARGKASYQTMRFRITTIQLLGRQVGLVKHGLVGIGTANLVNPRLRGQLGTARHPCSWGRSRRRSQSPSCGPCSCCSIPCCICCSLYEFSNLQRFPSIRPTKSQGGKRLLRVARRVVKIK